MFILLYEVPACRMELFLCHFETTCPLFLKFFFKHYLCLKSGMVSAREPECFASMHSVVANQDIFNRQEQRVTYMKRGIGIHRRHDDGIGFALSLSKGQIIRIKTTRLLPEFVDFLLGFLWIVGLGEFVHDFILAYDFLIRIYPR